MNRGTTDMTEGENLLEIRHLYHSYLTGNSRLPVLKDVNLSVKTGEWLCLFGASGSGKTTLLNLIGALELPEQGEIWIDGVDITRLKRRQAADFRGKKLGFIFQSYHLIPELDVFENTVLAGQFGGRHPAECRARAKELLIATGLQHRLHHRPAELSGGEKQRCAIARALLNCPKLLLADEPTGNLDAATGAEILNLFQELRRQNPELTILMITHNRELSGLADRTLTLIDGHFA